MPKSSLRSGLGVVLALLSCLCLPERATAQCLPPSIATAFARSVEDAIVEKMVNNTRLSINLKEEIDSLKAKFKALQPNVAKDNKTLARIRDAIAREERTLKQLHEDLRPKMRKKLRGEDVR